MFCFQHSIPNLIEAFKPAIGSGLVPHLPPDSLLHIQPGLIAGQVCQVQARVCPKEHLHLFSSMPSGSVYIQPDRISTQSPIQQFQTIQKAISITTWCPHKFSASKQRSHPSKDIQPCAMLARGGDSKPLTPLSPPEPQARMQAKARLILKNYRFSGSQALEFFLMSSGTSLPPLFAPEDMNNSPVSTDSPTGASKSVPGAPSALSHTGASNVARAWGRPTAHDSSRIPMGHFLSRSQAALESTWSSALDDQDGSLTSAPLAPPCSLYASKYSSSDASGLRHRLSIPAAVPPIPATKPQPLSQCGLPACPEQRPTDDLDLLQDALTLDLDFSYC